jgi:hypothetical protein
LHGQSTPLNFPPNAMGRMKKNPEFLGNTWKFTFRLNCT